MVSIQHQLQLEIGFKPPLFSERGMPSSGAGICVIRCRLNTEVSAKSILGLSLVAVNILKGHWQNLTFDWGPGVIDLTED